MHGLCGFRDQPARRRSVLCLATLCCTGGPNARTGDIRSGDNGPCRRFCTTWTVTAHSRIGNTIAAPVSALLRRGPPEA